MRMPENLVAEAREAVERGARLLDQRRPKWYEQVNAKTLDLSCGCDCVLGQVYGGYEEGLNVMERARRFVSDYWHGNNSIRFAERHAFCTNPTMDDWAASGYYNTNRLDACWHLLDRLWIEQIKKRREAAAA